MCQVDVYLKEKEQDVILLKDVALLRPQGDKISINDIYGQEKLIRVSIKEVDFMSHKVILEKVSDKE